MDDRRVAFIGLGLMGAQMSRRLLEAGYEVRGYDVDPVRVGEHRERGGVAARSIEDAVEACETVVLSLPDSDVARQVLFGEEGITRSESRPLHVYDTTTGRPEDAVEFASRLEGLGVDYCDTTLSGNSKSAERGELVVMVGGPEAAYRAGVGIFETIGRSHHHVGPAGAGARMKLLVNHILTIHRAALAEGLVVAQLAGLDLSSTLEVLKDSLAYSKAMDVWGERMILGDHTPPDARLRQTSKDARLIVDHATMLGAPIDIVAVVRDALAEGERTGLEDMDNSAIIEVMRRRAGVGRVP
jgi:3-hydroxyisobutyrate dehydrogenase-like beta-hydroxyacid dehydrogenase